MRCGCDFSGVEEVGANASNTPFSSFAHVFIYQYSFHPYFLPKNCFAHENGFKPSIFTAFLLSLIP